MPNNYRGEGEGTKKSTFRLNKFFNFEYVKINIEFEVKNKLKIFRKFHSTPKEEREREKKKKKRLKKVEKVTN